MSDAYIHAVSDESERLRLEIGRFDTRTGAISAEIYTLWHKADAARERGRIADARRLYGRIVGKMTEQHALMAEANALSERYVAEKCRVMLEPLDAGPEGPPARSAV